MRLSRLEEGIGRRRQDRPKAVLRHEAERRRLLGRTAFNPEDGKRYTAKLTLSGDHLVTAGCVLGGLICQSFDWTRTRAPERGFETR